MAHDLFISYSTQDKTTADAACATLEAAGIRCWIAPRDIVPGAEWGEAIVAAIGECHAMLLIFSASANNSPQIRREVERAVSKGIPVIPLRIEDIAPTRSLEYFIGTVHWLDALTPPLESHLRRLTETVKAMLQLAAAQPGVAARVDVPAASVVAAPARRAVPMWLMAAAALLIGLGGAAAGWWLFAPKAPAPPLAAVATPSPAPAPESQTAAAPAAGTPAPAPPAAAPPSATPAPAEKAAAAPAESAAPAAPAKPAEPPAAKIAETTAAAAPPAAKPAESAPATVAPPSEPPAAKPGESPITAAEIEKILVPQPKASATAPSAAPAAKPPALAAAVPAAHPPAPAARPSTRRFDNPMVAGMALDYCRIWGHDCGKPAADAFCQLQGFAAATAFTPRFHAPPTHVIDTGQSCTSDNCARIADVTCGDSAVVAALAPAPPGGGTAGTRRFDDPMVQGVALDYCRIWAQDCGKPAADAFCQAQGFAAASAFTPRFHAPPTRVIATGQVCSNANCGRIAEVVCSNAAAAARPPAGARHATLEYGTNRSGFDMRNFNLPGGTPEQCRDACLAEPSCRAFTFVQPGVQGPDARCWLKHSVPGAIPAKCCVSGVIE